MMSRSVIIRVPATTSNLGPGFDCLGIAFRIYNYVHVRRDDAISTRNTMVEEAAKCFFKAAKLKPFHFSWEVRGSVPRSRGLGSSVTVRLGILHALNALSRKPLDREALYHLCRELEGHPDNAAPAAFGGFTVSRMDGAYLRATVPARIFFVLLIPPFEISTPAARKVLPKQVKLKNAIINSGNTATIAAAFMSRNYEILKGSFEDHFHQPYRRKLLPILDKVIAAGTKAGALGGWLSGSGSVIACIGLSNPQKIAAAMRRASGIRNARVVITSADNTGVKISPR